MIILKKISVRAPENEKDLFMMLYWDTSVHKGFRFKLTILPEHDDRERMWMGEVDRNEQTFDIRRNIGGLPSMFTLRGRFKRGVASRTVEAEIGIDWMDALRLLMAIGFVWTPIISMFGDTWGFSVGIALTCLGVLWGVRDLRLSEKEITAYIKDPKSVSGLVVAE